VGELGEDVGFALEAGGLGPSAGEEDLDGDDLARPPIPGSEDLAHAA